MTPFEVYPPQGVRPLMVHFEVVDELHIAMTFFGDTYRHRLALDSAGLERAKEEPAANIAESPSKSGQSDRPKRLETFYLMPSTDVSLASEAVVVTNLLTVAVDNVPVDVRLISVGQTAGAAFDFVQSLKKLPTLWVHGV